jgi:hypothetical protein
VMGWFAVEVSCWHHQRLVPGQCILGDRCPL